MEKMELIYLTRKNVIDTGITLKEAVVTAEKVLVEHGNRNFQNPPKPGVFPLSDAFLNAMPAYLPGLNALGIKWVSVFSSNPKLGIPSTMGIIILNDVNTGQPIAVMDGGYITAQRTAAASGVAAKYLANKDSKVMGIVGTGEQARFHLNVLTEVLKEIELVKVYDINEKITRKFIDTMRKQVSCKIVDSPSIEAVIRESDVVVTATGDLTGKPPIFMEEWLKEGVHVLPVHNHGWEFSALQNADKFVVDDWNQYSTLFHIDDYNPKLPPLYAELSEIIVGKKKGRETKSEKIVSMHEGMAMHDLALASQVVKVAKEKGLGIILPYME
ncbi:ornithine cyclodeaminase family protein [uncultured Desulfosarcina sp.]|uniref:ornithine cyclodeaminase family protein n=1 Tax=uncultured Desulfosarcina sp. TaxID=218289 RepID=UPI0029C7302B|nr:ornithine cyclodeaminase family protein [uncultured Desulfosarcina sp.]